jgi:hypothetical protein
MGSDKEDVYLIYYDDAGKESDIIIGEESALKSFEWQKDHWNCYLFKMIKAESEGGYLTTHAQS